MKHKCELSNPIKVCKGTLQGGLSSPFIFTLFYQEMVKSLAECTGGININGASFNLFVYTDDILLTSLTATGLQTMINVADKYITDHGLRFNPSKTECTIFDKCHLDPPPEWRLGGTHLLQTNSVNYLGVTLSHWKPHEHVDKRIIACRRAYFALQGAGVNNAVADVDALSYIWNAAIRHILTYGINCINILAGDLEKIEKIQSRLLKAGMGIHKFCRSSPILKALNVSKIDNVIETSSLKVISAIFSNSSRAKIFYCYLLKKHRCDKLRNHTDLIARVRTICSQCTSFHQIIHYAGRRILW